MKEKVSDIPIGIGNEKRVFAHSTKEAWVTAEYRNKLTNEEIKGVYYFTKLIHYFFPDNYPNIFKAGNTKNTETATFEAERIDRDEILTKISEYAVRDEAYLMGEDTSNFSEDTHAAIEQIENVRIADKRLFALVHELRLLGIPVDSRTAGNFSILPNGTVVYLDIQQPFVIDEGVVKLRFDTAAMFRKIATLPEDRQREPLMYLTRTMELYEELKKRTEYMHPLQ